ncbi:hypothetical protein JCM8097_001936 [Rhodosporidiobolus ruineniae]
MPLFALLHRLADKALEWVHLLEKRQVGWKTLDRKSGKYMREQLPLWKKLKLLLLFNPLTEWIDFTHAFRYWLHERTIEAKNKEETPKSKAQIQSFIDFYGIKMKDFEPADIDAYETFQDFFIRRHTAASRPLFAPSDPTRAVNVADARVIVFPTVTLTKTLWIKGYNFSLLTCRTGAFLPPLDDAPKAEVWADGAIASYRLSPQDYHRYHSPVSGTVRWWKELDGDYYGVDPLAVRSRVPILNANARSAICIDSPEFGQVLFVAIGATDVGTVKLSEKALTEGARIEKGEEVGLFEFGGSSIIVAFEKGRIEFDDDLQTESYREVMVDVEVKTSLGRARSVS